MKKLTSLIVAVPIIGIAAHQVYKSIFTTLNIKKKNTKNTMEAHHILPITHAEEPCLTDNKYSGDYKPRTNKKDCDETVKKKYSKKEWGRKCAKCLKQGKKKCERELYDKCLRKEKERQAWLKHYQ
jgi:hypothetical protein